MSAPVQRPGVSVVIPTHNRRNSLARSINSVLGQSSPPSEVIVVDDGSTDGTQTLMTELARKHPSIVYLRQEQQGAAVARNAGIAAATGDLIAFQDSDDEWAVTLLEQLTPHVVGRRDVIAFCSHRTHHRDGSRVVVPDSHVRDPDALIPRRNVVSTQTVLADRALFGASGVQFDPRLRRFQDWDLWLTLLERRVATFVHVPEVLVEVHREADSISEGSARVRDASLRYILRKHARLLVRRPRALGRIMMRGYVRPALGQLRRAGARVGLTGALAREDAR